MPHAPVSLGWFSLCLRAQQFEETVAWYRALGFTDVGGNPEHGYVVLANGPTAITVMGFLKANLLCFRGADVDALSRELGERGLAAYHRSGHDPSSPDAEQVPGPRHYDASAWPAEFHTDADGQPLAVTGAGDFLLDDPEGNALYFDSVPVERVRFDAGERFGSAEHTGELAPGQPDLGRFVVQLHAKDPATSQAFYEQLGLRVTKQLPEVGYVELSNDLPVPFTIGLNSKTAPSDVLYFDCPDLAAIPAAAAVAESHPDGASVAMLRDPEGNLLYFRQGPRA